MFNRAPCHGSYRLYGICALCLGLLATGCTHLPTAPPTQQQNEPAPLQQKTWWRDFNDPLLSKLIDQALQANTSIRSAQAALQQARALRDVKVANSRPGLSLSGSAQRSQTENFDASNSFRAGLDASWEVDVFGAVRSGIKASEADTLAAQASLR